MSETGAHRGPRAIFPACMSTYTLGAQEAAVLGPHVPPHAQVRCSLAQHGHLEHWGTLAVSTPDGNGITLATRTWSDIR